MVIVLCAALALVGCKTELYSSLPENQANEMMALLMAHGISAEKGAADKGMVPISVSSSDLPQAVDILRDHGYPKDVFDSLGTVFAQKGLVSSPLEERVRFIYGLSQTLSETLAKVDGVTAARVHIVLPEDNAHTGKSGKSTASVFLKTRPGIDLSNKIPDVKQLVQASVQGLAYDDVVVSLFEGDPATASIADGAVALAQDRRKSGWRSPGALAAIFGGIGFLAVAGIGGGVYFKRRGKNNNPGLPAVLRPAASKRSGAREAQTAEAINE
jgi:type III secretion protein J